MKSRLKNFNGKISLTADVMGTYNFVRISLHFIDETWSLKKWVIKSCPLDDTSPWDVIIKSEEDWGIKNKISSVTLSSFSEYDTFEYIKDHLHGKKKLSLNGQLFGVYCCGEFMSQMMQYAFGKIQDTIGKARLLYNPKGEPLWYLTSFHLKQTMELRSMGEYSSKDVTDNYDVQSDEECEIADRIYKVADGLFEKECVTANLYLHHLHGIRAFLTEISSEAESFEASVAKGMLEKLDKYWNGMFMVLAIAAVLDPRFKMKYVEFTCAKVGGSQVYKAVSDALHNLYADYLIQKSSSSSGKAKEEGSFTVLQELVSQAQNWHLKTELEQYLEEPLLPCSEDFCVLKWWKISSGQYPTLSMMVRDFLAVPISLATYYKAFYTEPRPVVEHLITTL